MRIFGSKPGAYGAGLLPLIDSRNWRDDADLAEVYTAWGGFAYGRDLDGVPARAGHGARLPPDRGGGQEHRHPRARHRRLRRLLPVPRRHDRHRPRADRPAPPPRTSATAPGPDAVRTRTPVGGDRPRLPRPRGQPPLDGGDARGTATRAPSSWPPPSTTCSATTPPPAWWPTGCTSSSPRPTCSTRRTRQVHGRVQPVGAARHRRAAAGGGRARHVGAPRPATSCAPAGRSTSRPRATWRTSTSR